MAENFKITNSEEWNSLLHQAENGDSDAMMEVAFIYEYGLTIDNVEIVKPDPELAFSWTKRSCENGNEDAIINYAHYLSAGEYCERNTELAMQLLEKAMRAGDYLATFNLGTEYRDKQNFKKAFELYLEAHQSNPELSVGLCYYHGLGLKKTN